MPSLIDRLAYLSEHPIYQDRLQQLIEASPPERVREFLDLLPDIRRFYDLRFLHDCLCHVVDQLEESGHLIPADFWHYLCWWGAISCLPLEAVSKLLSSAEQWTKAGATHTDWLARAQRRHSFQRELFASGLTQTPPISLGLHCLPWDMFGRWGFYTGAHAIQTFTPMSAAHHHPDALVQLLRDGSVTYAKELYAMASASGLQLTGRADGKVLWNHHYGTHWHADDFAFFRLRTSELISNFEKMVASAPFQPLHFLLQHKTDDQPDFEATVARIWQALSDRVGEPFTLTVINDAWREPNEITMAALNPDRPNLRVIFAPPPSPEYVWHVPSFWNTDVGEAYEFAIVTAVREVMARSVRASQAMVSNK